MAAVAKKPFVMLPDRYMAEVMRSFTLSQVHFLYISIRETDT